MEEASPQHRAPNTPFSFMKAYSHTINFVLPYQFEIASKELHFFANLNICYEGAITHLRTRKYFENRERHCSQEGLRCLVSDLQRYKRSIELPKNRDKGEKLL
ncbi:hypothetical protein Syun_027763 [Stephania yunnanensis]|uniref:Uncharacterized protein n=1 Tax=Stephania yunnanensis TaxID=152371 RepID=A0AAP0ELA4_9MAGN